MSINPREIYNLLLDTSQSNDPIREIIIGLTWTMCEAEAVGLAMSPAISTRVLPWSGTLAGQSLNSLTPWIRSWDAYEATVGMAAINAAINSKSELIKEAEGIKMLKSANLAVFDHFLPLIKDKKVVVIGRYPGLSKYENQVNMTVIERQPTGQDLPDPACEYYLPEADWVFLTATSIVNKTFPRLVELSQNSQLVLMGPTLPWLPELGEMGINYLAGVRVTNLQALRQTVAEGGGVRIFATGVEYCVCKI
jgi:uncharacterized protein (DUF4213/DUF364 family)